MQDIYKACEIVDLERGHLCGYNIAFEDIASLPEYDAPVAAPPATCWGLIAHAIDGPMPDADRTIPDVF